MALVNVLKQTTRIWILLHLAEEDHEALQFPEKTWQRFLQVFK